jgi:hypothetical protein
MMTRRTWIVTATLVAILSTHALPALAQFSSALEGTVVDTQGGVVPGATVTITNEETGVSQTLTTSAEGYYRLPSLPGGLYSIRISLSGFKTALQEHVRVQVAETKTINLALDAGAVEEQVTVSAAAPLVETAQARVSGVIEESQVKDLPLVGRNFFNLVVLTPGVTGRASGGGQAYAQSNADLFINEYGVAMNANGARTESNNFMVDSATISSSQRSGVINVTPNPEVVEEVRVAVNNFSVETGRNGSVLVTVVTKSGTNQFHGSGSYFYTNDSLQGKNDLQKQTANFQHPEFARKESSWGFGGPLQSDRTFFFTSGDVLRSDVAINRASRILTPQFKDFMRANRPNNISTYVMNTFQPSFTAERNFLTAGQLLSTACAGGALINSPVGPIPCNLPVTGEGTFNTTSPRTGLQWTARIDHYLNDSKDRFYGAFNRTTANKVLAGTPDVYPDFNINSPTDGMHLNTNWTRIISPNLLNEVSFSWVRVYGDRPLNRPDVPGIQVTGIERYQTTWGPNDFVQNNFEWRDVVTWTRGAHTLKTGGEYARGHADNEGSRVFNRPIYTFASVFDFAADNPLRQENLAIDPSTGAPVTELLRLHRTHSLAAFAQEDWKVRSNLTLSMGLRYEGFLNISDSTGDMTALEFASRTGNLRQDLTTARIVERPYPLNGGLWSGGLHTFAPRASVAWDPTNQGKLSVRGGWGRFYERMSNQLWDSEYTNLPGFAVTTATIFEPVRPVFGLGRTEEPPFSYPRPSGLTSGLNAQGGLVNGRAKADLLDPDIGKMYSDNWFAGVQRGLGRHMVVEADYIGSIGRNMYLRYNVNRFNGDMLDGRFDGIIPGVSSLLLGQSTDRSHYHGGTVAFKTNFTDLQFGGAYTFGKAIDFSSTITPAARPDAFGPAEQDEGPSDFDIRHKLAMSLNWTLPEPASGAMRNILGGWQIAGVLLAQTGTPFSVVCNGRPFVPIRDAGGSIIGNNGCDYNADNEGNDRPNAPSFGNTIANRSDDDFLTGVFRAADFPVPTPGTNGDVGRNAFRGPGYFNVDVSLIKSVRIPWFTGDEARVQFRLEAFNAFNTTNLENPVNNMSDPLFGRSILALPGRILQVSGRLSF